MGGLLPDWTYNRRGIRVSQMDVARRSGRSRADTTDMPIDGDALA